MKQLFPVHHEDVDAEDLTLSDAREPVEGRPWLIVNMATTADGATALTGRSGGIGGTADHEVFHALRSAADIVLVGAGTMRAENYGPVRVPDAHIESRHRAGRDLPARLAVISRSCTLDPGARLFSDPHRKPLIYTVTDAPAERVAALEPVAEIVQLGSDAVDPTAVLADLGRRSVRCVVCEGGPTLNGQLIEADIVDEWSWTIGPMLAAGPSARASHGTPPVAPRPFRLDRILHDGRDLITRYVADRRG